LTGTTPNFAPFQPPETPFEDTSVAGTIPLYGILDFTDSGRYQHNLNPPFIDGLPGGALPLLERMVMQKPLKKSLSEYELASPMFHVKAAQLAEEDPHFGPFAVIHGTNDALASAEESLAFFEELQKVRAKFGSEGDVLIPVVGA